MTKEWTPGKPFPVLNKALHSFSSAPRLSFPGNQGSEMKEKRDGETFCPAELDESSSEWISSEGSGVKTQDC